MAGDDKRCGTCKWYSAICATWGSCGVPVPDCLDVKDKAEMHAIKAGGNCPCWEPKQCETESFQCYSKRAIAKIAEDAGLTVEQLTAKIMRTLELVIDSPEGKILVSTYEFRPKQ